VALSGFLAGADSPIQRNSGIVLRSLGKTEGRGSDGGGPEDAVSSPGGFKASQRASSDAGAATRGLDVGCPFALESVAF
jgi:hypothetical protein